MECKRAGVRCLTKASQAIRCRNYVTASRPLFYPRLRPNARSLTVDVPVGTLDASSTQAEATKHTVDTVKTTANTTPWFMEYNKQFEEQFPLERREKEPIPELPSDVPAMLQPLAEYMTQDLVLKDLSVLDLRDRENPWGNDTIMLLCTARSERQLRSSAESLKGYLRKREFAPRIEGLINWENTKVKRRRRRKMLGRANYQVEDDRLNWLFIEVGGHSGVILQLFSEDGRREYALEELWQGRANNEVVMPPTQSPLVSDYPVQKSPVVSTNTTAPGSGPLSRRLFSTVSRKVFSDAPPPI